MCLCMLCVRSVCVVFVHVCAWVWVKLVGINFGNVIYVWSTEAVLTLLKNKAATQ